MYEILLKNALRDNKKYFLIIFDLNAKTTIENQVHVMNQYAKYNSTTYRLNYDVAKAKLLYKKPIESSVQS